MNICPVYRGRMNHRSQIITLYCLQDPLFSCREVFGLCSICAWPPDCLQTGHTWADANMQSDTSLALLLPLPLNTFPAYIALSARQLFTIFTSLWLSLTLNLSPSFSVCQSQQLWCWIINDNLRPLPSHQVEEYRQEEEKEENGLQRKLIEIFFFASKLNC